MDSSPLFLEDEKSVRNPEIEIKVAHGNVLIRIHCAKQKGILAELLGTLEGLNMEVGNTNVTPFGNSSLDITIIAETEKGFCLTMKEVATSLRAAFWHASA